MPFKQEVGAPLMYGNTHMGHTVHEQVHDCRIDVNLELLINSH